MKFYSKKYDFEVEILIRLIWAGVQVENIKIGATYEAPSDKVSHKHKINDRLRLLLLNLSLITVSLLTERTSPAKSAFAFSIGVFVGVLPVFGFHAVIVSGIAVLFRLNFIYLWMGTHISTPIFIPFLIYASKKAGGYFFQHIYKNPVKATESFLVGSVLLGILMAAIFYVVVFYLKKKLNQKHKIWSADDRNQATTAVINFSISKIGLPWTYSLLKIVALFDYLFLFRVRAASNEYWRVSAYKLSFIQRQRKVFQNIHMFLKTKADTAYLNMKITNVFTFDMDAQTSELLENKKKDGQKLFLISSHAGVAGLNTPRLKAAFLNHEPIVIVSDRPTSENFEQILFFKKLAHFEASELRLALDKNFEVHFIFCFKTGLFKYKLFSERSVENASLSEAERLQDLLNQYVRLIEKHLRQYPDQWFNFFPFWSTPPESASPTTILQKAEPQP